MPRTKIGKCAVYSINFVHTICYTYLTNLLNRLAERLTYMLLNVAVELLWHHIVVWYVDIKYLDCLILRNVGNSNRKDTASHPRSLQSATTPL
jgi:hypothetical protein